MRLQEVLREREITALEQSLKESQEKEQQPTANPVGLKMVTTEQAIRGCTVAKNPQPFRKHPQVDGKRQYRCRILAKRG